MDFDPEPINPALNRHRSREDGTAAWVGWLAVNPRRRLSYGMPVVTPLLNAGTDVRQGLEVRRDGVVLADPHVLEVVLASRGRLDIPSTAFDKDRPLILDVGAPILDVLQSPGTAATT